MNSDDKFADPKYKIKQELRKFEDNFMSLLTDIQDRLSRRVSTERIATFVMTYVRQYKVHRQFLMKYKVAGKSLFFMHSALYHIFMIR